MRWPSMSGRAMFIALGVVSVILHGATAAAGQSIQDLIDQASDGDEILVPPGVYTETIDFGGRHLTVRSTDGPDTTIIDATGLGTAVIFANQTGESATLDGFTITGGSATNGGGMLVDAASPMIVGCVFVGNSAQVEGGGLLMVNGSEPVIVDCLFEDNSAGLGGGGAQGNDSAPLYLRCDFIGNTADFGAGVNANPGNPTLVSCRLVGNHADLFGGGQSGGGDPVLVDCLVTGNTAGLGGGGLNFGTGTSSPIVINSSIAFNETDGTGGGIRFGGGAPVVTVVNSIVYDNEDESGMGESAQIHLLAGSAADVHTSCVMGWSGSLGGFGNIGALPRFADPAGPDELIGTLDDDLSLLFNSPCIDAADNLVRPPEYIEDIDGNPRFVDDPGTPDTGLGTPPIVDMGAYEFQGVSPALSFWNTSVTGLWTFPSNWIGGVPGPLSHAVFDESAPTELPNALVNQDVVVGGIQALHGDVQISIVAPALSIEILPRDDDETFGQLIVDSSAADDTTLTMTSGTLPASLTAERVRVAVTDESAADLFVQNPQVNLSAQVNESITIGERGTGSLQIVTDVIGSVTFGTSGNVVLGERPSAVGKLRVVAGASQFTQSSVGGATFAVGDEGTGELDIFGGAKVISIQGPGGAASVGRHPGSHGEVVISGSLSQWSNSASSFTIAESGSADVSILDGARLATNTLGPVTVGLNAGADGFIFIEGDGSEWEELTSPINIGGAGLGVVRVCEGAAIEAFGGINVLESGTLLGCGTAQTSTFVRNFGTVEPAGPGLDPLGNLTIQGSYVQKGTPPNASSDASGELRIQIAESGEDGFNVTGQAILGGGVIVETMNGFEPSLDDTYAVVTAGTVTGAFDVAYMPGLATPGRFLSVEYAAGAAPGGDDVVQIIVDDLESLFDLDDPDSVNLDGAPTDGVLGDFTGDGVLDLAVILSGGPGPGSVLVFESTEDGFVPLPQQPAVGVTPMDIDAGHLDGDDTLDLVVVNMADESLTLLLNDGDGAFQTSTIANVGVAPRGVAAARFMNGDAAALDLAIASTGDESIVILTNDGTGGFQKSESISMGFAASSIDPEDFEKDGVPDIAAAANSGNTIGVLFIDAGGLGDLLLLNAGESPVSLSTADLDLDGLPDIATVNQDDGTVSIILNEEDLEPRSFAPAVDLPVDLSPSSVAPIDLELDGDVDLAIIAIDDFLGPVVQVLRNDITDSPGDQLTFVAPESFSAGGGPLLVLAGDVDGDMATDLVAVNEGLGGIAGDVGSVNTLRTLVDAPPLPGDLNGDGVVNGADIGVLLANWGPCDGCPADINGDGVVSGLDLGLLLGGWS